MNINHCRSTVTLFVSLILLVHLALFGFGCAFERFNLAIDRGSISPTVTKFVPFEDTSSTLTLPLLVAP